MRMSLANMVSNLPHYNSNSDRQVTVNLSHGPRRMLETSRSWIFPTSKSWTKLQQPNLWREGLTRSSRPKVLIILSQWGYNCPGSTYYGIGGCAASICESIFMDVRNVRPLSHFIPELGVCLSLPAIIGFNGIVQTVKPHLSPEEEALLKNSAESMKKVIAQFDL